MTTVRSTVPRYFYAGGTSEVLNVFSGGEWHMLYPSHQEMFWDGSSVRTRIIYMTREKIAERRHRLECEEILRVLRDPFGEES